MANISLFLILPFFILVCPNSDYDYDWNFLIILVSLVNETHDPAVYVKNRSINYFHSFTENIYIYNGNVTNEKDNDRVIKGGNSIQFFTSF